VDLRVPGLVVLIDASVHTASTADAAGDVQAVAEHHAVDRPRGLHLDGLPVLLGVLAFQAMKKALQLVVG
jgi:hypothetical protein